MTVFEARVVQVLPLRRCKETVYLVSWAPLAVSLPVIENGWLTLTEEGAEMVRVLRVFASTTALALHNNNPQITTIVTAITLLFLPNIPSHLER
jgi:hypothetical protein